MKLKRISIFVLILTLFTVTGITFAQAPDFNTLKENLSAQTQNNKTQIAEIFDTAKQSKNTTPDEVTALEKANTDFATFLQEYQSLINASQTATQLSTTLQNYFAQPQMQTTVLNVSLKRYEALLIILQDYTNTLQEHLISLKNYTRAAETFGYNVADIYIYQTQVQDKINLSLEIQEGIEQRLGTFNQNEIAAVDLEQFSSLNLEFAKATGYLRASRSALLDGTKALKLKYEK